MSNLYTCSLITQDTRIFNPFIISNGLINNAIDSLSSAFFGKEINKREAKKEIYSLPGAGKTQTDFDCIFDNAVLISIEQSVNVLNAKLYKSRADEVLLSRGRNGGTLIDAFGKSTEEVLAILLSL